MRQNMLNLLGKVIREPGEAPAPFWREMLRLAVIALGYGLTVRFGLLLVAQPEGLAAVWPASGLALAIVMLSPRSQWAKLLAVVFAANVAGNWSGGNSLPVSLGFALANTLETALGAWVLTWFCKEKITFERTTEILALLCVAVLVSGVTALLGAAVSSLAFKGSFMSGWRLWWASDGLGIILITPFIVSWANYQRAAPFVFSRKVAETVLLVLCVTGFAWLLYGPFTVAEKPLLRNYMFFPLLIWLAFRFNPRGIVNALLLFASIAVWYTLQGYGIFSFASHSRTENLVALQVFLAVSTCSGLVLSAVVIRRKRAEEEKDHLEALNRQLQKSESLDRMAGAIAHHFNNRLMVVMGNLELVMEELPRDTEMFGTLSAALLAARQAAEVSRALLTYLGQTADSQERLDLSEACSQNISVLCAGMPKNVVFKTDLISPGPAINANESQILQVIASLLINAWEAGGANVCLTVKKVAPEEIPAEHRFPVTWQPQEQDYACVEVADTGCGIAHTEIEKLFEPFYSTKMSGRGLGLSVITGIVRAHGGCITVASERGHGSTFRVFLPVSSAAEVPATSVEPAGPTEQDLQGGTVLVVEDEESVRKLASLMLTRLRLAVLEARDGTEALDMFRQHQDEILCVLCDLTMPGMDGWATLSALRALRPGLPVILASGYDEAQVMHGDHPERPQAFLGKPYAMKALHEAIGKAVGKAVGHAA